VKGNNVAEDKKTFSFILDPTSDKTIELQFKGLTPSTRRVLEDAFQKVYRMGQEDNKELFQKALAQGQKHAEGYSNVNFSDLKFNDYGSIQPE
jgi:hypothetical protein